MSGREGVSVALLAGKGGGLGWRKGAVFSGFWGRKNKTAVDLPFRLSVLLLLLLGLHLQYNTFAYDSPMNTCHVINFRKIK